MSALYIAAFDRALLTLGTMTLADGVNGNIVVDLDAIAANDANGDSSTVFFHNTPPQLFETAFESEDAYEDNRLTHVATQPWGLAVTEEIQSQATANSWTDPGLLATAIAADDGFYFIGYSSGGGNFSITWSAAAGRALFGFAANVSGASSYTGTIVPTYIVKPDLEAVSNATPNFEAEGRASMAVNAAGGAFSTGRYRPVHMRHWVQQFESKALVWIAEAAAAHPETHQSLHDHCVDGGFAFIVYDGGFGIDDAEAFMFAQDGLEFAPQFAADQWSDFFHVPYRCLVMGRVVAA